MTTKTASRWIPVGERLPEKAKEVLVTIRFFGGVVAVKVGRLDRDGKWNFNAIILAWMPLPKPFRDAE